MTAPKGEVAVGAYVTAHVPFEGTRQGVVLEMGRQWPVMRVQGHTREFVANVEGARVTAPQDLNPEQWAHLARVRASLGLTAPATLPKQAPPLVFSGYSLREPSRGEGVRAVFRGHLPTPRPVVAPSGANSNLKSVPDPNGGIVALWERVRRDGGATMTDEEVDAFVASMTDLTGDAVCAARTQARPEAKGASVPPPRTAKPVPPPLRIYREGWGMRRELTKREAFYHQMQEAARRADEGTPEAIERAKACIEEARRNLVWDTPRPEAPPSLLTRLARLVGIGA